MSETRWDRAETEPGLCWRCWKVDVGLQRVLCDPCRKAEYVEAWAVQQAIQLAKMATYEEMIARRRAGEQRASTAG
ncbi:MAG: hypothetical protein OXI46_01425 [Gemmatimonadota bacterium]|nr:hypothetical protein [Gemmatimonadota bacterium]